jgi:hypothetical protein
MNTHTYKASNPSATPHAFTPVRSGLLQRKCACGGSAGLAGECEECGKQALSLQRATRNSELAIGQHQRVPRIVNEVLRSSGQALDAKTRTFMEPSFGHDFSNVRVHADDTAGASARAVNALAYTVGNDLVFAAGQYSPGTAKGARLIAHELTHVVQQAREGTGMQGNLTIGQPHDSCEQEADRMADAISGTSASGGRQSATISALPGKQMQHSCASCESEETKEERKPERKSFTYEDLLAGEVEEEEPETTNVKAGTPQKTSMTANATSPATSREEKFERPHEGSATIECAGGDYVVKLNDWAGKPCGISDCVTVHESSHIDDWRGRWPTGCKKADGTNQADGYLPTGGAGYDAFLKKSECDAHTKDLDCAEKKLESATGKCKRKLKAYARLTRRQKAGFC